MFVLYATKFRERRVAQSLPPAMRRGDDAPMSKALAMSSDGTDFYNFMKGLLKVRIEGGYLVGEAILADAPPRDFERAERIGEVRRIISLFVIEPVYR
jgi:hypothetical protein